MLVAKQKELEKEGKGNKPNAVRMLTTLWLNKMQFFEMRGCQEHRVMKWGDVERKTTADGTAFLGPVVRIIKPINTNPRLKVNPGFSLAR